MSPERSEHLLAMVAPFISKKDTRFRKCISVAEGLALTLGKSTVSNIISETCEAIYQCLKSRLSQSPRSTRTVAKYCRPIWGKLEHVKCNRRNRW